jgi:hypothetical protein
MEELLPASNMRSTFRMPREGSVINAKICFLWISKGNLFIFWSSGSTTLTRRIERFGHLSIVVNQDLVGSAGKKHSGSGQPGSGMSP